MPHKLTFNYYRCNVKDNDFYFWLHNLFGTSDFLGKKEGRVFFF